MQCWVVTRFTQWLTLPLVSDHWGDTQGGQSDCRGVPLQSVPPWKTCPWLVTVLLCKYRKFTNKLSVAVTAQWLTNCDCVKEVFCHWEYEGLSKSCFLCRNLQLFLEIGASCRVYTVRFWAVSDERWLNVAISLVEAPKLRSYVALLESNGKYTVFV